MWTRAAIVSACIALSAPALAQQGNVPRTSFGAPSLEGVWSTQTATPLERPAAFDGPTTTEEKAKAFAASVPEVFQSDNSDGVGSRTSEWWEFSEHMTRIGGEIRTSLIVDPRNGRMPYSDAGRVRLKKLQDEVMTAFEGPEARPSPERCLSGGSGSSGVPLFVSRYNTNYQIVQTREYLVLYMEQNRDVRLIRIGGERLPDAMKRWMGDSIGHWEGDTLVVETTGFVPGDAFKPSAPLLVSENALVTERFTRISDTDILYRYTVEDPSVFTQAWTVEMLFSATANRLHEYACHEGNYSMTGMLAGGRVKERGTKRK
jgi:hypothetical protein